MKLVNWAVNDVAENHLRVWTDSGVFDGCVIQVRVILAHAANASAAKSRVPQALVEFHTRFK